MCRVHEGTVGIADGDRVRGGRFVGEGGAGGEKVAGAACVGNGCASGGGREWDVGRT